MDIDTELRVIAELRALARAYGLPGGGMERVDELLDERGVSDEPLRTQRPV